MNRSVLSDADDGARDTIDYLTQTKTQTGHLDITPR